MLRRFPIRTGRNDDKWCASPHPIDRLALADVRKGIAGLQQTFSKQKTTIEKLLLEIALLKRQVKSLEDEHNKSIQASIGYLQQRVASMEDAQHVAGESAIVTFDGGRAVIVPLGKDIAQSK